MEWHDPEDGLIRGIGTTVCGRQGSLVMPGFISRMEIKRCSKCCAALGVPPGIGNPYNWGVYEAGDVPPAPLASALEARRGETRSGSIAEGDDIATAEGRDAPKVLR